MTRRGADDRALTMALDLSILIATWNRSALLRQTLASLSMVDVPEGVTWRILVCDNNSTDDTRAAVESAKAELAGRVELRYLFEPTQGKSHALNRMIAEASGDWLVFLDDDVRADRRWLAGYVEGMSRHVEASCLGGALEPWLTHPASAGEAFLMREYPAVFGLLPVLMDTPMREPTVTAYGANMAIRRSAMPADGFSTDQGMMGKVRVAGEDVGLQVRLLRSGATGWLLAGARVGHHLPAGSVGVGRFCRWQMGIGRRWALERGRPAPGRLGVAWWAWMEMARRSGKALSRWRPWNTRDYYDALGEASQYWGFLRG